MTYSRGSEAAPTGNERASAVLSLAAAGLPPEK